ncbi:hypothetical protein [Actinocorallia aurantiaca]|uniref:hypothetical protein n=1 Tax=Actinocorallia aurantiaca TaxID=46204 RepID=UPI0031DB65DE
MREGSKSSVGAMTSATPFGGLARNRDAIAGYLAELQRRAETNQVAGDLRHGSIHHRSCPGNTVHAPEIASVRIYFTEKTSMEGIP